MPQTISRKSWHPNNADLHGSASDKSEIALAIVNVINDLDFPEAKRLVKEKKRGAQRRK